MQMDVAWCFRRKNIRNQKNKARIARSLTTDTEAETGTDSDKFTQKPTLMSVSLQYEHLHIILYNPCFYRSLYRYRYRSRVVWTHHNTYVCYFRHNAPVRPPTHHQVNWYLFGLARPYCHGTSPSGGGKIYVCYLKRILNSHSICLLQFGHFFYQDQNNNHFWGFNFESIQKNKKKFICRLSIWKKVEVILPICIPIMFTFL